jgi:HK97 family phage major capsid protein
MGTNNVVGINTQAKGADPTPDAIYKGMTLVRSMGFTEPSVGFIHPNDWQDIRLLRTADGIYIFGSPIESGPDRIWGMPVVVTTAALENTMTLGDYRNFSALFTKRGITVAVSDSHAYYFTRGTLAVRADMRVAMVHFRPLAFCTVTGI